MWVFLPLNAHKLHGAALINIDMDLSKAHKPLFDSVEFLGALQRRAEKHLDLCRQQPTLDLTDTAAIGF